MAGQHAVLTLGQCIGQHWLFQIAPSLFLDEKLCCYFVFFSNTMQFKETSRPLALTVLSTDGSFWCIWCSSTRCRVGAFIGTDRHTDIPLIITVIKTCCLWRTSSFCFSSAFSCSSSVSFLFISCNLLATVTQTLALAQY